MDDEIAKNLLESVSKVGIGNDGTNCKVGRQIMAVVGRRDRVLVPPGLKGAGNEGFGQPLSWAVVDGLGADIQHCLL